LGLLALVFVGIITISVSTVAQTPSTGPTMRFTATTANVSGAGDAARIDLLRWSTDAERDQLLAAWNLTAPAAAAGGRGAAAGGRGAAGGGGGGRGGAGRGGGRGGDTPDAGAAAANAPATPAAAANAPATPAADGAAPAAAGAAAGAGGGRGGRGGGGGGRGGAAAPAADATPLTPAKALAAALQTAQTVGYLWTSESAGYSLRFAQRFPQPDGSERVILATDRRLGAWNNLWKPAGGAALTDYDFSIIELHLNAKGDGEGKTSLTGKVTVDSSSKTFALEGYMGLPIVFKDVKRRTGN